MIDLLECNDGHRWQLFEWRNMPEVRDYMYKTDSITRDEHERWYSQLLIAEDRQGWIIRLDEQPVGAAFITGIDRVNRRASWAFYLADPSTRGRGVGGAVEYLILEHAFSTLELHKLCCEVLSFNDAVVAMHKKFGFVEEGTLRDHWLRGGQFVHTHVLAMFSGTWEERREAMGNTMRSRGLIK